jgi:hypothetical protein
MKLSRNVFVLSIFLLLSRDLMASGPCGIYGIIERVVFEPNERSPERIQVWGAFEFVDGGVAKPGATSPAKRGYLYFSLPLGTDQTATKAEWSDLKAVAGTGQAVGFGNWGYIGAFSGLALRTNTTDGTPPFFLSPEPGYPATDVRIRPASEPPAKPGVYSTNAGIAKLSAGSHAAIINQLKEALKSQ